MVKGSEVYIQDRFIQLFHVITLYSMHFTANKRKLQTAVQYIYLVPLQHIKSILVTITGIEV